MRRNRLTKRTVDGDALYTVRFSSGRSSVYTLVRARLGHVERGCGERCKVNNEDTVDMVRDIDLAPAGYWCWHEWSHLPSHVYCSQ